MQQAMPERAAQHLHSAAPPARELLPPVVSFLATAAWLHISGYLVCPAL